jgi:asparagine synthase (glutamine-hydrolysing)
MCGIAGFLDTTGAAGADPSVAQRMADRISHRGPDDSDVWAEGPVALAHRRLSIIDLSPAGHQPMLSACGRYVMVFNGEIYNYEAVRREIEADGYFGAVVRQWRGHSDTEVILAAIGRWGFADALQRLVGMFAIALWDRQDRVLRLARDRLGEKPVYFGKLGSHFLFGSELKALRAHPAWRGEIDRGALSLLMRHNYIPAPYSIYRDIQKIPPGNVLQVSATGDIRMEPYWSLPEVARRAQAKRFGGSDLEAVDALERCLSDAIAGQMVSDVPLGAFLSGGIDSSTVVALMQARSNRPVRTFSIGFHEEGFNEAQHAKRVAQHLGTDHTELYVTSRQAQDVIPRLSVLYDEPFSDSSQIPTFLVSQLAKQHVTVSLSGDGGDELFGGYNRYFVAGDIWRKTGRIPVGLRATLARGIRALSPQAWSRLLRLVMPMLPARYRQMNVGDKLHKLAGVMGTQGQEVIYLQLLSHWQEPAALVRGGYEPATALTSLPPDLELDNFVARMMLVDAISYLPDDILVKVDRAAMGVSLETRVPMLDHRVVEFAWSLPFDMKVRHGEGKWLLKQVLYRHVPRALLERPKMGFGVPIDHWLRGPLKAWAEDLLDPRRMDAEGFLDPGPVQEKWRQHQLGSQNWQYLLWDVLMFQDWLRTHHA